MIVFWVLVFVLLGLALLCIILPLRGHLIKRYPSPPYGGRWPVGPKGRYIITLISMCIFIVVFSLGFYLKLGSSGALKQSIVLQQRAVHLQALLDEINNDPQKAIIMMKIYLKNHPNDKHAQYLLHKLYKSTNN